MLGFPPQTLNTSYPYVMGNSGSGALMVTKSNLHLMALVLASPQMELSLFHAMRQLLQFKTLILEQLWPNFQWPVGVLAAAAFPLMTGLLLLLLITLSMFGISPVPTLTLLRPSLAILIASCP